MLPGVPVYMNDFPPSGAVPPLTEEGFMDLFMQFSHVTGIRLNEQDFNIEGRQVNPWALHRTVFARNGFDSVTANGEWPIVGAALGFPPPFSFPSGDPTGVQPSHCTPAVAHRLQQLYQNNLRHFDQAYASDTLSNTVSPANAQPSSTPSTSHVPPPPGQQGPAPSTNFADLPLPQLRSIYVQMINTWVEGEKSFQASSNSGGEGDFQRRQQLRLRLDTYKQRVLALQEFINNKARASGDLSQLVNGPSWLSQTQRPTELYPAPAPAPEIRGQYNSHSLYQASVNQVSPQRRIPTPQQNFVPSATAQSNLTQMSSHVSASGLPPNGPLAQVAGAPPQQSTQIAQPPSQQPIQPHKIPPLPEDRFKSVFMQYTAATGLRLTDRDLIVEGRPVNLWALHRTVFMRNGFESVSTNDEWPIIGVALGFPIFSGGDGGQPARCAPAVAHRLQQLYNSVLRQFEQAYISSIVARIRASSQIASQAPQPQAQPHQPTEADYQAFLASISPESPAITPEAMSILPRFSHTSGADLEAHRVPQYVIAFIEQNRVLLQRAAQDQSGFRAGITSTKNAPLDHRAHINDVSGLQTIAGPPQVISGYQQLQMQRQASHVSMGAQMATSSSVAQNQGGVMPVPMNPAGMSSIGSSSVLPPSVGSMQIRRPTQEALMAAKRWVDEQKQVAFSRDFDGVAGYPTIPESEIHQYNRDLERLGQILGNIEKYIHFAFAALGKGDVVQRMFTMMASARAQLEELKKSNPRYVLELHTIRGMIQEADNMDKGLKIVLGIRSPGSMMPSATQPPPQSTPTIPAQFALPTTLTGTQWDEPASSPEEMSDSEDFFDDEVRIPMDKLRI